MGGTTFSDASQAGGESARRACREERPQEELFLHLTHTSDFLGYVLEGKA